MPPSSGAYSRTTRCRILFSSITHSETFCSHPAEACVQHISTSDASALPALTYAYSVAAEPGLPTPTVACFDNSTLKITGTASNPGMAFEILARASTLGSDASVTCAPAGANNATLTVRGATAAWLTWVGGTDYDMDAGDAAHGFSFKGADPHPRLVALLDEVPRLAPTFEELRAFHLSDYSSVTTAFSLDLGQEPDFDTPTDELKAAYRTDTGNVYLEWLLFNYGRYLLAASARGALPANLQGKWAKDASNPWSAGSCQQIGRAHV